MNSEQAKDKIERLQAIAWNLLAYAQDTNMYELSRPKMISEIIENGYMSKSDLELLDYEGIIEEYEEYMEGDE